MPNLTDIITGFLGSDKSVRDITTVRDSAQTGTITDTGHDAASRKSTQQVGEVTASTATNQTNSSARTQSLSDAQLRAGSLVLDRLSSQFDVADLSGLARRLTGQNIEGSNAASIILNRALGADQDLASSRGALVDKARATNEVALNTRVNQLAGQAGTQFSSLVQKMFQQGEGDLEISLAALEADLRRADRVAATDEMLKALAGVQTSAATALQTEGQIPLLAAQANAAQSGAVSGLLDALKGGITTSEANSLSTILSRQETQRTVNEKMFEDTWRTNTRGLNINENIVEVGKQKLKEDTSLLDLLKLFD